MMSSSRGDSPSRLRAIHHASRVPWVQHKEAVCMKLSTNRVKVKYSIGACMNSGGKGSLKAHHNPKTLWESDQVHVELESLKLVNLEFGKLKDLWVDSGTLNLWKKRYRRARLLHRERERERGELIIRGGIMRRRSTCMNSWAYTNFLTVSRSPRSRARLENRTRMMASGMRNPMPIHISHACILIQCVENWKSCNIQPN